MIPDAPADILRQYFIDKGLVGLNTTAGVDWPCTIYKRPPGSDSLPGGKRNQVAIIDMTPKKDGRYMRGGANVLHYPMQVIIRSKTPDEGRTQGVLLQNSTESIKNTQVDLRGTPYNVVNATLSIGLTHIGEEEGRGELFIFELRLTIEPVS